MAEKKNKLEMVPAAEGEALKNTFIGSLLTTKAPDESKIRKLNLPPLLKPIDIPIGQMVSGKIIRAITNFTGSEEKTMRSSRVIQLKHESGQEFLLPLGGVLQKALRDYLADPETKDKAEIATGFKADNDITGQTLFVKRTPDGKAKKYGGKPMFMFDVALETT